MLLSALLGSNALGSLIGWVGGWLNRKLDFDTKKLELEHELKMRDKDLELLRAEAEGNFKVAQEEASGRIESEAYRAVAAGYEGQFRASGVVWIDALTRAIRPIVTIIFTIAALAIGTYVLVIAMQGDVTFSPDEWKQWVLQVLQWIFFQAGVVIGWWFANRPSRKQEQ